MATNDDAAFQKLPTPCAITNLEGTILDVNQSLSTLVGITKPELIGTHLDSIMSLASSKLMKTYAWPIICRDKSIRGLDIKIKNAQGGTTSVIADCALEQSETEQKCYWVFCITQEKREREQALISAQQEVELMNIDLAESKQTLKAAHNELKVFTYNVSHDLREPLITINGFVSILQSELSEHLNEKQQHRFGRINSNIEKIQMMMDDLLKLSLITQQEIQFDLVCLSDIVNEQLTQIKKSLTNIGVKVYINEPLPAVVSNSIMLGQCLSHLFSNAITYREPSRQLNIQIKAVTSGEKITLSISDNGIGIAEKDLDKIFNVFEHSSQSQGSGVGLTIVKAAVEKMKGSISVVSEFEVGSTFSITLPKPLD